MDRTRLTRLRRRVGEEARGLLGRLEVQSGLDQAWAVLVGLDQRRPDNGRELLEWLELHGPQGARELREWLEGRSPAVRTLLDRLEHSPLSEVQMGALLDRLEGLGQPAFVVDPVIRLRRWWALRWAAPAGKAVATSEVPAVRRLAGWEQLELNGLPTALPLTLELKRRMTGQIERPHYWVPVLEEMGGQAELEPVLVSRAVARSRPVVGPWAPDPTWSPIYVKRAQSRDFRTGYQHVWALETPLKVIRRPYLLRLDLARVPPQDRRTVEQMLKAVPIARVEVGLEPLEWVRAPEVRSPMAVPVGPEARDWAAWFGGGGAGGAPGEESSRASIGGRIDAAVAAGGAIPGGGASVEADGKAGGEDG